MENIQIRTIQSIDNKDLAAIVRNSLMEFGAARPGTVYFDPSTDHLISKYFRLRAVIIIPRWPMAELPVAQASFPRPASRRPPVNW